MSDIRESGNSLVRRILEGDGKAASTERKAAFNNKGPTELAGTLVDKVATRAYRVAEEDIAAKASGLREDQVFEIAVCSAIGQATRQYDTAIAALEAATGKE